MWGPEDSCIASGHWVLGSEFTSRGAVFRKLRENIVDLYRVNQIDALFYEDPINMLPKKRTAEDQSGGNIVRTNKESILLAAGLSGMVDCLGEEIGARVIRAVNMATWRSHFIGRIQRGTKRVELKDYAMQRCRQLGFRPQRDDEAEAIGILDYACSALGIQPYWTVNEVLRPELVARRP